MSMCAAVFFVQMVVQPIPLMLSFRIVAEPWGCARFSFAGHYSAGQYETILIHFMNMWKMPCSGMHLRRHSYAMLLRCCHRSLIQMWEMVVSYFRWDSGSSFASHVLYYATRGF